MRVKANLQLLQKALQLTFVSFTATTFSCINCEAKIFF